MQLLEINKNTVKTGDILLVSSYSWLSQAIQFFQRIGHKREGSKYNHAAVFCWLDGCLYVIEADQYGIAITDFKKYLNTKDKLLLLHPVFIIKYDDCRNFMLNFCGHSPYDYKALPLEILRFITFGLIKPEKYKSEGTSFRCSEWAAFVMHQFNNKIFPFPGAIDPVDIYENENFTHKVIQE